MNLQRRLLVVSFLEPWSMGPGMGAPSLYETLVAYAKSGWEVHYVTASKRVLGGGSHEQDIPVEIDGVMVHRFAFPSPFRSLGARIQGKADRIYFFPKSAAEFLEKLLFEIHPSLIYAYEEGAVLAISRLRKKGLISSPVLHRFQGTILGSKYSQIPVVLRKMESWLALRKKGDLYVMTNDGTCGDHAIRYWNKHVTNENILFVRNGIDKGIADNASPRAAVLKSFGISVDSFVLLMTSRLAGWKRVDRGIDLVAALQSRYPSIQLVVVGDGEIRSELEAYAHRKGVGEKVHFLGSQPRPVVKDLMHSADIFLSLYDISNCGNPLFEALLCGRAVVTLDNGATSEVIRHEINGMLVHPEDNEAIQNSVTALIERTELRGRLESGAREWAKNNLLTWEERMHVEISWVESKLALND